MAKEGGTRDRAEPDPAGPEMLEPGRNCWRIVRAARATPLVDAAAYFSMLAGAMRRAEHEILIVGWDIHALTRLEPEASGRKRSSNLRETLAALAADNASLAVRILLWDFTVLYASGRLPFPKAVLDWSMPANVSLALDDRLPVGACHHQKIVVVDDRLAFMGGIDLTERRWDTPAHASGDPRRVTSRGEAYPPFHDAMLAVDGEAAAALGELCRERWSACTRGAAAAPAAGGSDPWPQAVPAYWRDVDVAIARTLPAMGRHDEPVVEILHLYLDTIAAAERHIYIENQYLTSERICDALVERLAAEHGPEIVIVTQTNAHSWLEENTMGVRRRQFLNRLGGADEHGRLRVLAPQVPGVDIDDYKLHSKLMVVDDRFVQIGSANLNNRSMGLDSECNALVRCRTDDERALAGRFRNSLLAEHLGAETEAVEHALEAGGSLRAVIDALTAPGRTLVPIPLADAAAELEDPLAEEMIAEFADPERPVSAQELLDRLSPASDMAGERAEPIGVKLTVSFLLTVAIAIGIAIALRAMGLDILEPEAVGALLERAPSGPAGALVTAAAFVIGGLVAFPVTVLIFAAALTYGPWLGLAYAALGTYLSAALTFGVGRLLGRSVFMRWPLKTVTAVSRHIVRRGVLAIAMLRVVPIAPFTVVNVLAGATDMKFRDYAIGTVVGMTPGIAVMTALGGQLGATLRDPSAVRILVLGVVVGLWVAVGVGLQRFVNRLERRRRTDQAT